MKLEMNVEDLVIELMNKTKKEEIIKSSIKKI